MAEREEVDRLDVLERYEALPKALREDMESRFMWAASTGSHPDATVEGAVARIVAPLLDHSRGAVAALERMIIVPFHVEGAATIRRYARDALRELGVEPPTTGGQ